MSRHLTKPKRTLTPQRAYDAVYAYCVKAGLIKRLERHLKTTEEERFKKRNISKEGLHLLDAVHCVYDRKRTRIFLEEISAFLKPSSVVIEAGVGTGVLSLYAASVAKRVYGIELNATILKLARRITAAFKASGIFETGPHYLHGDATKVELPEKADIIINENIYTGMFFEKQVQIARHLRNYLKPRGKMIPSGMRSYATLVQAAYPSEPKHKELFVPLELPGMRFHPLSVVKLYDRINFMNPSSRKVDYQNVFVAHGSGTVNGLLIYSEVLLPSGRKIKRHATTFFNNDIVLAISPGLEVKKGSRVRLRVSYAYGDEPAQAVLKASILK